AVEVLVEGAPRDGGGVGDLGDRRLVVAVLGDDRGGGGEQSLALVEGDDVGWQAVAAAVQWTQAPLPLTAATIWHRRRRYRGKPGAEGARGGAGATRRRRR